MLSPGDVPQPSQKLIAAAEDLAAYYDLLARFAALLERELREKMSGALRLLSSRERGIVVRYYGLGEEEPASLETIGQALKLSRERVRQIRNSALAKIRGRAAGIGLLAFL